MSSDEYLKSGNGVALTQVFDLGRFSFVLKHNPRWVFKNVQFIELFKLTGSTVLSIEFFHTCTEVKIAQPSSLGGMYI